MIARVGAAVSLILIAAVVAFQVALALGAPWGEYTQGGAANGTLPIGGRLIAGVSIVVLLVFAAGLAARVGWGPLARAPRRLVGVIAWVSVSYAAIAVVLNLATSSARERMIWAPVSVLLLAAQLTTVVGTRPKAK